MLENHPTHGILNGHALYGIASFRLTGNGLKSVVDNCVAASKNSDCRDKYFLSYVGAYDASNAHSLRGELPALEAIQTSVAATTAELAEAISKLDSCGATKASFATARAARLNDGVAYPDHSGALSGLDAAAVKDLLMEARAVIIQMRSALK